MKILIAGDSFAADWTVKYAEQKGWPNLLSEIYSVVNIAQAGVSEYKIYQQIMSIDNLAQYDFFIISHTSPYRAVTRSHPIHNRDKLHQHADLIPADIDYHASSLLKRLTNPSLRAASAYLKHHYDIEYHETTYKLFRSAINEIIPNDKLLVISNFPNSTMFEAESNFLDLSVLQKDHSGCMNHLSNEGNQILCQIIVDKINELT